MTSLDKPERGVTRVTLEGLDGCHGCDRGRRLVVSLQYGDLITIRPHGTRRSKTVRIADVYFYAIRCEVNKTKMEKLRERKAKLEAARAERRRKAEIRRANR